MKKCPCQQLLFGSAIWFPISFHIIDMDARAVRFMNPNQLPHTLRKEKTVRDKQRKRKRESCVCLFRNSAMGLACKHWETHKIKKKSSNPHLTLWERCQPRQKTRKQLDDCWRQKWHLKLVHAVLCTAHKRWVITNVWMLDYKSFCINNSVKSVQKGGNIEERPKTLCSKLKQIL